MKNLIRFDWAVKRLLRNKANFSILEGFLSELLNDDIKIDHILESEGNRQTSDDKTNVVDMLVSNSAGEFIIIEVQNNFMQHYLMRTLYGTSKIITDNMLKGMDYDKVKKVISINIVYFDLGSGDDYVYHGTTNYVGIHKKDILTLSGEEEKLYHTSNIAKIYPEYYIIKVNQFDDVANDTLDEWINFFKYQEVKEGTTARGLKDALMELDVMKLSQQERLEYESYIKESRDNYATIVGNYNKGLYEGEIKGKKEGMIAIAKNCLAEGMNLTQVAKLTGLTEDEIKSLIVS